MSEPNRPRLQHPSLARCELCRELIGVYEPLVVRSPSGWRMTSVAAEPELRVMELPCLHLDCVTPAADALAVDRVVVHASPSR